MKRYQTSVFRCLEYSVIDVAFERIGLDFDSLFPSARDNSLTALYEDHEWIVKNVQKYGVVINAVPPKAFILKKPWEEWFSLGNKTYHHVLYLREPYRYDEVFKAPQHDEIHPPRTLGRIWWVVDDPDPSPVLTRTA